MEYVNQIMPVILALPGLVKWPGLVIAGFLVFKGLMKMLGLRLIGAATNFLYAVIVILVMYHWGEDIHAFLLHYLKQYA